MNGLLRSLVVSFICTFSIKCSSSFSAVPKFLRPFSSQMAEGVLKPETWAAIDDPFDHETDDEDAEEFQHM